MASSAEQAFHNAKGFHEGAIRCAEEVRVGDQIVYPMNPMICCTAFAAELYMKSLVLRRRPGPIRDHDLYVLFTEHLNDEERAAIGAYYEVYTREGRVRLLDDLKVNAEAFVKWRYAHEEGFRVSHLSALKTFAVACYLAVTRLVPDWEVNPYYHDRITADLGNPKSTIIVKPESDENLNQLANSFVRRFTGNIGPETNISEGENKSFSPTAPMLNFYGQTATLNLKVGRRADPDNGGTDEPVE